MKRTNKNSSRGGDQRPYPLAAASILLAVVLTILVIQIIPGGWAFVSGQFKPANSETTETAVVETTEKVVETTTRQTTKALTPTPAETTEPPPQPVSLLAVGDIILHQSVIDGGRLDAKDDQYNYNNAFRLIKPIIEQADLALANFEGTTAGPPYTGYPFFCAPDSIADAIYWAGFRVVWTANNHIMDRGLDGLLRTTGVFLDRGFDVIGTRLDETKESARIIQVNGISIGLLAYTFETIGTAEQRAINGNPIPAEAVPLIDTFNPYREERFEKDLEAIIQRAEDMRSAGAELILLAVHWGNEYETTESSYQRYFAQRMADAKIDLIIGHHPHVLQPIDVLTSQDGTSRTLVFYSISNFLHNMEYTTHHTVGYALDAIIARVIIDRKDGRAQVIRAEIVPTFVTRHFLAQGIRHMVVPVLPALADPEAYESDKKELEDCWQRIQKVLSSSEREDLIPIAFTPE